MGVEGLGLPSRGSQPKRGGEPPNRWGQHLPNSARMGQAGAGGFQRRDSFLSQDGSMERQGTLPRGGDIYPDAPKKETSRAEPSGPGAQRVCLREGGASWVAEQTYHLKWGIIIVFCPI